MSSLGGWHEEKQSAWLYRALASCETDAKIATIESQRKLVDEVRARANGIVHMLQDLNVNLDLLEAAGQPNPRDLIASGDWTWDRVMEMGDAAANATG